MSDFNFQRRVPERYIEMYSIGEWRKPDMVALTGDYITRGAVGGSIGSPRGSRQRQRTSSLRLRETTTTPSATHGAYGVPDAATGKMRHSGKARHPHSAPRTLNLDHEGGRYKISGVDDLWSRRLSAAGIGAGGGGGGWGGGGGGGMAQLDAALPTT